MASALKSFANCTMTFKIISGYTYNPESMNDEPVTTPTVIRALLQVNKTQTQNARTVIDNEGVLIYKDLYEGRCIEPVKIPAGLKNEAEGIVEFDSGLKGSLIAYFNSGSPYYDEISVLGQPFSATVVYV